MRPVKLTMHAFGPYVNKQVMDFGVLSGHGLYLIAGETGAGKTTIFDAISFALFGEASMQSRKCKMLRSDYVDQKVKTYVELEFISNNNCYTIKRTIGRNGQEVELILPDGTCISKIKESVSKINEIIGFTHEQFSQIVMIAQNDFLRFLQSSTSERGAILRSIFATVHLQHFQDKIKLRTAQLEGELRLYKANFERHMVDPYRCEEVFKEWEQQIREYRCGLDVLFKDIKINEEKEIKIVAEIALAKELEKKIFALEAKSEMMRKYLEQSESMELLKERCARCEIGMREVKPYEDKLVIATKDYKQAKHELDKTILQKIKAEEEYLYIQKEMKAFPSLEIKRQEFSRINLLWEKAQIVLKKLNDLNRDHQFILEKACSLSQIQIKLPEFYSKFTESDREYKNMENDFFKAQAQILATKLTFGRPCPVCGSIEHVNPAKITVQVVSEAELIKHRNLTEILRKQFSEKSEQCAILEVEITSISDRFRRDISEIIETLQEFELSDLSEILSEFSKFLSFDVKEIPENFTKNLSYIQNEIKNLKNQKENQEKELNKLENSNATLQKKESTLKDAMQQLVTLSQERERRLETQKTTVNLIKMKFYQVLKDNNFTDLTDYKNSLVAEDLEKMKKTLNDYENNKKELSFSIKILEQEIKNKNKPNVAQMESEAFTIKSQINNLYDQSNDSKIKLEQTILKLQELSEYHEKFMKLQTKYSAIKQLCDVTNGNLKFETYAQMAHFDKVLHAANFRLRIMSQDRYLLRRKDENEDGRRQFGLDFEVFDGYTGKLRSAGSLSGGESFMAALSLALGLSDVVVQNTGGIRIEAMFIDEGFGSLDANALDLAIKTLSAMTIEGRTIGIISHVAELRERIEKQVLILKTPRGSEIKFIS